MFAKGREPPSVVSTRVLRTHRLNEVENFRLHGKIRTIDTEIQSNYSHLSDEIDGVRKNLTRIKKIKNNLNISVERRKLLRERGVCVIPSLGAEDDEGVTLRRPDGKLVVVRGKECYDGEVIRKCIDLNFELSNEPTQDTSPDIEDEQEADQATFEDVFKEKGKVFHYRIIIPPLRPGSRRNFKDYETLEKDEQIELNLPPSEDYFNSLRGSSLKVKSTQQSSSKKLGKSRNKTRRKSAVVDSSKSLSLESHENTNDTTVKEESSQTLENKHAEIQSMHSARPQTADETSRNNVKYRDNSPEQRENIVTNHSEKKGKDTRPVKKAFEVTPSDTASHVKNEISVLETSKKLLERRPSNEESVSIQITQPISDSKDTNENPSVQEIKDLENDASDVSDVADDVSWTAQIERITLTPHDFGSKQETKKHRQRKSQLRPRAPSNLSRFPEDSHSTTSFSSKMSKPRTESFNSNANSFLAPRQRRRVSNAVGFSEQKLQLAKDEVIYDARPDKAISKGYTTMQMTIGGKQVKICVPKFSKDEVIDRARAKTAVQMADDRTRASNSSNKHKQIRKPSLVV